MQGEDGSNQRQRQCDQRNDGSTHIGKEQEQHDDYEDTPFEQRLLHISDGAFDEAALAEDVRRYFYIGGQVLLQVFERGFQFVGQFQRTGGGLLGGK